MVAILEEFAAYLARGFGASTLVVVGDEAGPPDRVAPRGAA
jgi:hypothetical protein